MDIGGYWATLVSIILGLGIADLLMNFYRLLHERRRIDWDALPLVWATISLLWVFNYWWAVAANLDGSRQFRVVLEFVLGAIPPIILFLIAASVLPRAVPAEGRLDMRAEWAKSRGVFLTLFVLNQCVTWVSAIVVHGAIVWDAGAITRTAALALFVLALLARNRRIDWAVALIVLPVVLWRLSVQPVA